MPTNIIPILLFIIFLLAIALVWVLLVQRNRKHTKNIPNVFGEYALEKYDMEIVIQESKDEFVNWFFHKLLLDKMKDLSVIRKQLKAIGFDYESGEFLGLALRVEDNNEELIPDALNYINEFLSNIVSDNEYIIGVEPVAPHNILMLINVKMSDLERLEIALKLNAYLRQNYEVESTIGVGQTHGGIEKCHLVVAEAMHALHFRTFMGKGAIIDFCSLPEEKPRKQKRFQVVDVVKFVSAVESGNEKGAKEILENVAKNISPSIDAKRFAPDMFWQLMGGMMQAIHSLDIKFEDVFGVSEFECYQRFTRIDEIEQMKIYLNNLLTTIFEHINASDEKSDSKKSIISNVKQFIEEHYSEDISLSGIADHFGISAPYLSTLFKKQANDNFNNYLRNIRLKKAMDLLVETDFDINLIATKIGYHNTRSFLRVFKYFTGMTPTEYRKNFK